jgi:ABC-type multidrug transport system fused ATPase/permease subunit
LSARYAQDSPEILHRLSFTIRSGERVGVVGRTGSGKSSLMLSLLRMIPTSGSIRFDGLDINHVNLDILRTSVTIIPQQPELMSGTVRENLDPFSQNDDLELNNALRASGLFKLQEGLDESEKITLDTIIASLGSNLSLGQRQVIALARAIVRRSKVLILDEATAAIGSESILTVEDHILNFPQITIRMLTFKQRYGTNFTIVPSSRSHTDFKLLWITTRFLF